MVKTGKPSPHHNLQPLPLAAALDVPDGDCVLVLPVVQAQGHVVVGVAQALLVEGGLKVGAVALIIRSDLEGKYELNVISREKKKNCE